MYTIAVVLFLLVYNGSIAQPCCEKYKKRTGWIDSCSSHYVVVYPSTLSSDHASYVRVTAAVKAYTQSITTEESANLLFGTIATNYYYPLKGYYYKHMPGGDNKRLIYINNVYIVETDDNHHSRIYAIYYGTYKNIDELDIFRSRLPDNIKNTVVVLPITNSVIIVYLALNSFACCDYVSTIIKTHDAFRETFMIKE